MKTVFIIIGPTSTGKTSLALKLCNEFNGEIISADSRQIYKYMDIGTGKIPIQKDIVSNQISVEKMEKYWTIDGVKVWGYDLADPDQFFSAYDFALFGLTKIKGLHSEKKNVFVTGGTGFYIDILTGRVKPANIAPDQNLREGLNNLSLRELQERLEKLDPETLSKIDIKNPIRLIRAIEKHSTKNKNEISTLIYPTDIKYKFIGLTCDRNKLYKNTDLWLDKIWNNGLLSEVEWLLNSKYKDSSKLKGLVYDTAVEYINGRLPELEALEKIKFNLHAYIRRQETYFKKIPDITWVDINQDNKIQKVYNIING